MCLLSVMQPYFSKNFYHVCMFFTHPLIPSQEGKVYRVFLKNLIMLDI